MRGLALDLLRDTLARRYGGLPWGELRDEDRSYRPNGEDLPSPALTWWFGRQSVLLAADHHPGLFADRSGALDFLGHLVGPLAMISAPTGGLVLSLRSGEPCTFVAGVVAGVGEHYGRPLEARSLKCVRRGDNRCVLAVSPAQPAAAASEGGTVRPPLPGGGRPDSSPKRGER